jgi:hypothetical protein
MLKDLKNISVDDSCLVKRHVDWHDLQKKSQGWSEIHPDHVLCNRLLELHPSVNLKFAHQNLKNKLSSLEPGNDMFVITDIEISKIPLEGILQLIKQKYNESTLGVYIALLSYYITPKQVNSDLPDSYSESIRMYFQNEFSYAARVEDHSQVYDVPTDLVKDNALVEGANFIFVHPNIRFFLWK